MEIDCGRCEMRETGCRDCVVTALVPRKAAGFSPAAPGHLGEAEVKALGVLADAGLVPTLRFALRLDRPAWARAWTKRIFPDTKAS
jgi:hypothetical protein